MDMFLNCFLNAFLGNVFHFRPLGNAYLSGITARLLSRINQEAPRGVAHHYATKADKPHKQMLGTLPRQSHMAVEVIGRNSPSGGVDDCYGLKLFRGETEPHGFIAPLKLPRPDHERMCGYVLVGHPVVGHMAIVLLTTVNRPTLAPGYVDTQHNRPTLGHEGGDIDFLRWLAVGFGGMLNHVDIFLVGHPDNRSVVLYPYQQAAPVIIGEGRDGTRYFAGVADGILEILVLMLTLLNEATQIIFPFSCRNILHCG